MKVFIAGVSYLVVVFFLGSAAFWSSYCITPLTAHVGYPPFDRAWFMWVMSCTASIGSVTMFLHLVNSVWMTPSLWFSAWWEWKWRYWSVNLYLHTAILLVGDEYN